VRRGQQFHGDHANRLRNRDVSRSKLNQAVIPVISFDLEEQLTHDRKPVSGNGSGKSSSAFTLIEVLVAVAVMAFLVLIVNAMLASTASLVMLSDKKMDADGEARMVFDRMGGDFASMVKSGDVDYQFNNQSAGENGSGTLFFYSESPAISASATPENNSSVSLVGYRINNQYQLSRLGKGLQWFPNSGTSIDGQADSMVHLTYASYPATSTSVPLPGSSLADVFPSVLAANSTDANYHILGEGVFRFAFWFLLKPFQQKDGTFAPAVYSIYPYDGRPGRDHTSLKGIGLEDVQAIVVELAILDAASRQQASSNITWSTVASALYDPTAADPFVPPSWESVVSAPTFAATAKLSIGTAGQVRVFQRTFNLVTPSNQ
jgi:prepilin-type N-terminal cleavage/methylation domain-containing protein